MNQLWMIAWKNPSTGIKDKVVTPYLADGGAALRWFLNQKPFMRNHFDDITITPWQRGM